MNIPPLSVISTKTPWMTCTTTTTHKKKYMNLSPLSAHPIITYHYHNTLFDSSRAQSLKLSTIINISCRPLSLGLT
jgi:hypothetical protein